MRREQLYAGTLVAVGVGIAAAQVSTLATETGTAAVLLRSVPMIAVAAAVVYGGGWLLVRGTPGGHADRVLAWTLGGGLTLSAVVVLATVGRGVSLPLVTDALTGGVLVGLLVGLYDARSRERLTQVESFARKVKALNQYGKALNRSKTLDQISALCVEAVEFLVAGDGAAFVVVEDGGDTDDGESSEETVRVVDSTLRGDHELRVLESLAGEIDATDDIEAVRYAETGVELGEESPDAALVISVPTETGRALIVSLSTTTDIEYDEEDVDLLETLAAHVSTALSHTTERDRAVGVGAATDPDGDAAADD
ncbi:MAG: GAF domain-containing protein [Halobaculum sp.]